MKEKFTIGLYYSRRQIHNAVGGELQTYLPSVDGVIVAGCFTQKLNPDLPYIILVGDAPLVVKKAKNLCTQKEPIPIFKKISVNRWEFLGYFQVANFIDDLIVIQPYARKANRKDVVGILKMKDLKS